MTHRRTTIGYSCAFVPYTTLQNLGYQTLLLSDAKLDNRTIGNRLPKNMCSYILTCEQLIHEAELDAMVLTNCCNSSQRLYDLIRTEYREIPCFLLEVPRSDSLSEVEFYHKCRERLLTEIVETFPLRQDIDLQKMLKASEEIEKEHELLPGTIYILGASVSNSLIEKLNSFLSPYPTAINLCSTRNANDCCARMTNFISWFETFIDKNRQNLKGVIYISSLNCDHFLFNYPLIKTVCEKNQIPILGFEQNFSDYSAKQIEVRVEAFIENLSVGKSYQRLDRDTRKRETKKLQEDNAFRQRMRLIRGILPSMPLDSIRKVVANQIELFSETIWNEPDRIVWTNMVMPMEMFYAADLIPVNTELIAGWLASTGLSRKYLSESEGLGFSPSLCSYHKSTLGLISRNGIPAPRGMAILSHICDGQPGFAHCLKERYQTDCLIISTPFNKSDNEHQFLTDQFKSLRSWIETYTGRPLSESKLVEAIERSNQARKNWIEAIAMRKGEPLFAGYLSLRNLFGATFLFGSEQGLDITESFYNELAELKKKSSPQGQPKKRILWIHFAPLYDNNSMEYLETKLNCNIVMDSTSYVYWDELDPTHPEQTLADKCLSHFYLGDSEERVGIYENLIEEFRIDGIIHYMHNGCRAIPGGAWQIRKLAQNMGLPFLEISGDCIDPRGASKSQFILRLEAFSESLKKR